MTAGAGTPMVAEAVWALLDDDQASPSQPGSRLYTGWQREHRCDDPAALARTWAAVQADQRAGLHALLLADYEWGARLQQRPDRPLAAPGAGALRVLMFDRLRRLPREAADAWLAERDAAEAAAAPPQPDDAGAGVLDLRPAVDRAAFTAAIDRIQQAIADGQTYQVNYSYRLHGRAWGRPLALYRRLRAHQPVPYGAFIALPAGGAVTHVLSCSPELFLRHDRGLLTARPMKGTAARSGDAARDRAAAAALAQDAKNRAENLMIVDLLRNDLGRVAQTGTVRVPALFAVEPYATVLQMTSTVQAQRQPRLDFPALLRAAFPCGSITGAPKLHTMGLIAALENTPRGLYCGAIGWVDAPAGDAACGDFCLSVAIRTLTLGPADADGLRPLALGVGAGIVRDSRADDEHAECGWKARFLTGLDPGFQLIETLRAEPDGRIPLLDAHLARLQRSAAALGFACDTAALRVRLLAAARPEPGTTAAGPADLPRRLRLTLDHAGRATLAVAPLPPLPAGAGGDGTPVALCLAAQRLPRQRPLSAHKTTLRRAYDAGVRAAEQRGAFDSLFLRDDGRVVEGGRSTLFARLDGVWCTPPLADGALAGVQRARLLADPAWAARERTLTRDDLARADALAVCNALRGVLPARLLA